LNLLQFDDAIGSEFTVSLSGVRDLAGNRLKKALTWSFVLQDFGTDAATVSVSGFQLTIAFASFSESILESLKASLVSTLSVPPERLTNFVAAPSSDGQGTVVSFDILPASASARRAGAPTAGEIAKMLGDLSSSDDPFLSQNLDPNSQVCVLSFCISGLTRVA
jgi:hypothetical protein